MMSGNLNITHDVFLAGGYVWENRGQQIIRAHALNLRRNLLAALKAQQRQSAVRVPTPTRAEDWRRERRLFEHRLHSLGSEKMKHIGERKAVLLGERDVQAIVGCGSLQFKIEAAAKALAESQSPGLVDARTERSVDDQLHATSFIKEAFGNDGLLCGNGTEHGASLQYVFDCLLGAGIVQPAFFF